MKFKTIRFENIGPIRRAAIGRHRLSVFVGPNNSGKSIASRIIHGVCQLDSSPSVQHRLPVKGLSDDGPDGEAAARSAILIRNAGMRRGDIVTHSADSGRLVLEDGAKASITMDFGKNAKQGKASFIASLLDAPLDEAAKSSIYVPAGRTGTVQSLLTIMQIKSGLLNSVLRSLGERPGEITPSLSLRRQMPEHLEQFYSIVLETFSGGLDDESKSMFSRLFAGSAESAAAGGLPAILYRDPAGFAVEIGSAGSGIVSAFPIVAAMHRVEPGGTLIVEEPEAHMEPMRQLRLVDEIVRAAQKRDISIVLTTHSDFVVNAILGMVHNEVIGPADLGLYYFQRRRESYTDVEKIPVTGSGEAEQDMFSEALDALAKGSVISDCP